MLTRARTAAICVIRDAVDILPLLCGHYLRLGFDRLVFIDDGSTDGTADQLEKLAAATDRVLTRRSQYRELRQSALMTETANGLIVDGYRIIFPFDADEFWNIDLDRIRSASATVPSGLFVGRWVQFAQNRRYLQPSRFGLFHVANRAPILTDASPEAITALQRSFLCASEPKVGFSADGPVAIARGQHHLLSGPSTVLAEDLEVFHLPLRHAGEIDRRAARAPRLLHDAKPGESWQSRHFQDAVQAGRRDEVWAANSVDDEGFLTLPGHRVPSIPDDRLQRLLKRAWLYMALHHPRHLFRSAFGSA